MSDTTAKNHQHSAAFDNDFDPASYSAWQDTAQKSLRDKPLSSLAQHTADGLNIDALYHTRPHTDEHAGSPAEPRDNWDNRLRVTGSDAAACNAHGLRGLEAGITSLDIELMPLSGASCPVEVAELDTVLQGVLSEHAAISVHAGSAFASACDALQHIWHQSGAGAQSIKGAINADPLGTLARNGSLPTTIDAALEQLGNCATTLDANFPAVSAATANAAIHHNAGATANQELVAAVATACVYIEAMIKAGMSASQANSSLTFQLACDADFLSNVVKLRALKALWLHIARHYGAEPVMPAIVVETSGRMLSRREPWVNHLRNVSATTAAAVGGADSIIVQPHNLVDGVFTDNEQGIAERVARNTAIILENESSLYFVQDPMAGSYAVESLTEELLASSWQGLAQLQQQGGLLQALLSGDWQRSLAASAQQRVQRLQQETDIRVGVNRFNAATIANSSDTATMHAPAAADAIISIAPLTSVRDASSFEN